MFHPLHLLNTLALLGLVLPFMAVPASLQAAATGISLSITDTGAVGDGAAVNTKSIQAAIDRLAGSGGGTVVVPAGVFVSGALFLKPGVNLQIEKDAVLRCSTDLSHFPAQRTRIEGHYEEHFNPAFINADHCDGLQITGEGTLDGNGRPIWDEFWKLRRASADPRNFSNLTVPRARLCLIEHSKNVRVSGIRFKDSQFWNLHLYRCSQVELSRLSFSVPDDYVQAPSTDGIDVDSSQDVTIRECVFSVTDDSIALNGGRGPFALEDKANAPVERVQVSKCVFRRGHAAVTLGSNATVVRQVTVSDCQVLGAMSVLKFKLRSDTPQLYETIRFDGISVQNEDGLLIDIAPWRQYIDMQGQPQPTSTVRDVVFANVRGTYGVFGIIRGYGSKTRISDITLRNIDVQLRTPSLYAIEVGNLKLENVIVNGAPFRVSSR